MRVNKLQSALAELVEDGSITPEQASLVIEKAEAHTHQTASRKALFAEIGGYLGGAFVLIATITFVAQRFNDITNLVRASIFLAVALFLFAIAFTLGTKSAMRSRLASVLSMGSAISLAGSISLFMNNDNEPPTYGFIAGTLVAAFFFYRNRNELLHLGTYAFIGLTTIMVAAKFIPSPKDSQSMAATATVWIILAVAWIYLSHKNYVHETLGYVLGGGTLFLGIQILFLQNYHAISYALAILAVIGLARLFLAERMWPLLVAAILISTVALGEFVAQTLGGSTGAVAGLFVAGIALIASSIYASRSLQHHD